MAAAVTALVALQPGAAEAATGPKPLQRLAVAQTQLLLSHLKHPLGEQVVSPQNCNEGQSAKGTDGTFLLPTFAGKPEDATLTCHIKARAVLVDLFGFVVTEDNSGDLYPPLKLPFTKANLERICDDLVKQAPAAQATLDGKSLEGPKVSTAVFTSRVKPQSGDLYQESIELGHRGTLATTYCGHKAKVPLTTGHHVIKVTLPNSEKTVLTYKIDVVG
jgi:hypothetical protein